MAAYPNQPPMSPEGRGSSLQSGFSPGPGVGNYPQDHVPGTMSIPKSISTTNLETTGRCREVIARDLDPNPPVAGTVCFRSTPGFTLTLPDLSSYPPEFKEFVFNILIDKPTQRSLEEEGVLNWCSTVTKLVPIKTLPDGNCLLHAASLGMWGFQDRNLTLRKALSDGLMCQTQNTFYDRWRHDQEFENQRMNIQMEPHQWEKEWDGMVRQTMTNVPIGQNLESLDNFHVFVLANIIRRPIILYASPKIRSLQGGGTLQTCNFHGVYLPLLWDPTVCKRDPLPLAYCGGHFSALVVIEAPGQFKNGQFILPLVDSQGQQLPIKFTLPVEDHMTLLRDYLDLIQTVYRDNSPYINSKHIISTKLAVFDIPAYLKPLISGFIEACWDAYGKRAGNRQTSSYDPPGRENRGVAGGEGGREENPPKCINNCGLYGNPDTAYMCSGCFRKHQQKQREEEQGREQGRQESQQQYGDQSQFGNRGGGGGGSGGGSVMCPKCSKPGFPKLLGMCEQCYHHNTGGGGGGGGGGGSSQRQDPIYEMLPNEAGGLMGMGQFDDPPPLPFPRDPEERSKCRRPGCDFYGTIESRYYCSRCFEKNMDKILKEADEGPPIPIPHLDDAFLPNTHANFGQDLGPQPHFPISGQEQGGHEPPKCFKCQNFFGNEEYHGLCHGCFLNTLKTDGEFPQHSPVVSGRPGGAHTTSHPRQYQDHTSSSSSSHNHDPSGAWEPYQNRQGPNEQQRFNTGAPSRMVNATAPIANLSSQMADMSVKPNSCFVCQGGQMQTGDSSSYVVCAKHAARMSQMITRLESDEGGEEVRSKPTPHQRQDQRQGFQRNSDAQLNRFDDYRENFGERGHPPYTQQGGDNPDQRGRPPYTQQGGNGPDHPPYTQQGGNGPGHPPYTQQGGNGPGHPLYTQQGGEGRGEIYRRESDTDMRRGGKYDGYQPAGGAPIGGLKGNQDPVYDQGHRHPYPQQGGKYQGGAEWESRQTDPGQLEAQQRQHPPGNSRDQWEAQHQRPHPQGNSRDQWESQHQQPRPQDNSRDQWEPHHQHPHHARHHTNERHQDGRDIADINNEEGPMGGAVGGATGSTVTPPVRVKALCAIAGCSFKGYADLENLCPDCYIERYPKFAIEVEKKYPLV